MDRLGAPETAGRMAAAAASFLAALTAEQRSLACRAFGEERREWSYLPEPHRDGLPIGALGGDQRRLAHELIVASTSLPGYTKVVSVMAMEHVLRALSPGQADLFDPERYCLRVFGEPGDETWGWQLAGHHVSLNFTIAGRRWVSPTPCMLGAEPASYGLLAPLADDEELGFRFVNSLDGGAAAGGDHPSPAPAGSRRPDGAQDRRGRAAGPGLRPGARLRDQRGRTRHPQLRPLRPQGHPRVRAEPGSSWTTWPHWSGRSRGGFPTRWPEPSCTSSSRPGWTACASRGRAEPSRGSGTTSGSRALRCSSSTTTPRATVTTSIRRGAARRATSATTCWLSTTACTTAASRGVQLRSQADGCQTVLVSR